MRMSPDDARASTGSAPAANLLPMRYGLRLVTTTSVLTGVLLAMTAVSGLLLGTRGLYRPDPATLPTFVGQDAITLFAALPLLVASIQTASNGSLRGLLLWAAGLFYIAYSYAYYGAAGISMILADLSSGKMPSRVDQVVWPMDPVVAFPAMVLGRPVALAQTAAWLCGCGGPARQGWSAWRRVGGQHLDRDNILEQRRGLDGARVCAWRLWWTGARRLVSVACPASWFDAARQTDGGGGA